MKKCCSTLFGFISKLRLAAYTHVCSRIQGVKDKRVTWRFCFEILEGSYETESQREKIKQK